MSDRFPIKVGNDKEGKVMRVIIFTGSQLGGWDDTKKKNSLTTSRYIRSLKVLYLDDARYKSVRLRAYLLLGVYVMCYQSGLT